jgi:hypothetical protein
MRHVTLERENNTGGYWICSASWFFVVMNPFISQRCGRLTFMTFTDRSAQVTFPYLCRTELSSFVPSQISNKCLSDGLYPNIYLDGACTISCLHVVRCLYLRSLHKPSPASLSTTSQFSSLHYDNLNGECLFFSGYQTLI